VNALSDLLLVLLILLNLRLLGTSRLGVCINTAALQAVLLAALPLLTGGWLEDWVLVVLAAGVVVKAYVLPRLLRRAVRQAGVVREVEPLVGFSMSILAGVALLGASFYLSRQLVIPWIENAALLTPVALFTVFTGLFIIVTRRKAVTQVVGYLVMENGIWAFGTAFAIREPFLVEMGVLLDVFVAVFVMAIVVHHISRTFDHMDTDQLSVLKD
jgi:hydrogenase-4 component E